MRSTYDVDVKIIPDSFTCVGSHTNPKLNVYMEVIVAHLQWLQNDLE